ncbi:MAG: hypothetical protein HQM09_16590 [Candidatus Riflebacteria bacterium]|nr:hypothetical protein [Candidatus Riflebacteria bacterium]
MEKRRYSIQDIQRMTQLSPGTLQDILKKYRQHFAIEVVAGPEGDEMFMDQPSFERLIFIKQLELRQTLSSEELIAQFGDNPLRRPVTAVGEQSGIDSSDGNNTATSMPTSDLRLSSLVGMLDGLGGEIRGVESRLRQLLMRYTQVLRDMNQYREENRQLRNDLNILRQRQDIMHGKMHRSEVDETDEEDKKPMVN